MVMTTYQGASASDIENNVTRPLENVLNSVSNLEAYHFPFVGEYFRDYAGV